MCILNASVDDLNFALCAVTYREALPFDLIPSYRGAAVKYSYKITVGAQRFGSRTKLMRVPFRVLVVPGKDPVCRLELYQITFLLFDQL